MQVPLLHQQFLIATEKIRDLHRTLMLHSGVIPSEEMEQFLSGIRRMYEVALQLQHANAVALLQEMESSVKEKYPVSASNAVTTEPLKAPEASPVQEIKATEEIQAPVVEKTENVKPQGVKTESETARKKSTGDVHTVFEENHTIANRFADSERIGDKLGKQPGKRLSDQLKTPFKDLRSAIGLNEKFQFINQLFEGNAVLYNTAIDFLNSCSDRDAAHQYLDRISNEHNWEKQPETASTFVGLVDRRIAG
jgi:hypothetical protein